MVDGAGHTVDIVRIAESASIAAITRFGTATGCGAEAGSSGTSGVCATSAEGVDTPGVEPASATDRFCVNATIESTITTTVSNAMPTLAHNVRAPRLGAGRRFVAII
jgi:hypothetical protein